MLINFFYGLKQARVPVSIKEHLILLEALGKGLGFGSVDDFYLLSRTVLVKDEKYFDRFDKAFGAYFNGLANVEDIIDTLIPDDWVKSEFLKSLTDEEKDKIESLGGLEELIETFKKRLEEQKSRHKGGSKWIGTGGTSPFGNDGYHPEGIRVGGGKVAIKKPLKCGVSDNSKTLTTVSNSGHVILRWLYASCVNLQEQGLQTNWI